MALYRFEAKIISRDGGRSTVGASAYRTGKCATASAAYRAGAEMVDERTGQRFDYSKKKGVLGAEIMLPDGAPEWMRDRAKLWNAVEKIEKRKDAQLARDFVISLPHELSHEERVALTTSFVQKHFVSKGFAADIAWHAPEKRGDKRNFHAHVMVTQRRVEGDGFAKRKERANTKEHPMKVWKRDLDALRADWAEHGAAALEKAGLHLEAERFHVGNLRLDKQREAALKRGDLGWAEELDREPEPKQGPLATKMEREGKESRAGADRRAAKDRNAELANLKAEHAATTADIIDLQLERMRRGHMDDLTDEFLAQQPEREKELLEDARRREAEFVALRVRAEKQAEEDRRREEERKKADAVRAREGEVTDAKSRYAQALGDHYDVRDPYSSLARAAMAEHGAFARQQQEYRRQEAAEPDQEKRKLIRMAREIEACDYMTITSQRLAGISRVVAGPEAERRARLEGRKTQAELDDERAVFYGDRAQTLRERRSEFVRELSAREKSQDGKEHHDKTARDVAGPSGEMTDRKAERLSRYQNIGEAYATYRAERGTRSRGRSR